MNVFAMRENLKAVDLIVRLKRDLLIERAISDFWAEEVLRHAAGMTDSPNLNATDVWMAHWCGHVNRGVEMREGGGFRYCKECWLLQTRRQGVVPATMPAIIWWHATEPRNGTRGGMIDE